MKVDNQTLRDLEVLATGSHTGTLLAHLDRTRTKGGGRAWKRRLTRPFSGVEEIRDVQNALRFMLSNRDLFEGLPTETEIEAVDRHLHSNFATVRSTHRPFLMVESAWVRVRYPQLYRGAIAGRSALGILWRRMARVAKGLGNAPRLLSGIAEEIGSVGEPEVIGALIGYENGRGWTAWSRALAADRLAREGMRAPLARLLEVAHELDALRSMAEVTEELGFCLPEFREGDPRPEIEGMWHPFLEHPVPNDMRFGARGRAIFLTGPNMAGKSTHLKASGIIVLLAHVGMGVPARSCALGLMDRLVCAVRTEDSLLRGVSYFEAEARRVRSIAEWITVDPRSMVIVDEPFRGTNTKDAADATEAVLRAFCRSPHGCFLISSHLVEIATRIRDLPGVVLQQFEANAEGGVLEFPYRLRDGVSEQRLGMQVLRDQGVLAALERIGRTVRSLSDGR
ncbi:MAG: hypothetical protein WD960_09770 [Gemmatimonadota bacterium]